MNKIRSYANEVGHQIVGKLTRRPGLEWTLDWDTGEKKPSGYRHYSDDAGNVYIVSKTGGVCIVDAEGGVI